jgi:undecaprenyl-diphosphatase
MNHAIFYFFYNLAHHSTFFDRLVFSIAQYSNPWGIILAGLVLIIILITHKDWKGKKFSGWIREVIIVGISVVSAYLVTLLLKILVHAPRPFMALSNIHPLVIETPYDSFPSGHATAFFALAVAMYMYDKKWGTVFFIIAILISLSRVISGVHFPIDILAGAIIGSTVAYIVHKLLVKKLRE